MNPEIYETYCKQKIESLKLFTAHEPKFYEASSSLAAAKRQAETAVDAEKEAAQKTVEKAEKKRQEVLKKLHALNAASFKCDVETIKAWLSEYEPLTELRLDEMRGIDDSVLSGCDTLLSAMRKEYLFQQRTKTDEKGAK